MNILKFTSNKTGLQKLFSSLFLLLAAIIFFASCTATKNSYYFKTVAKDTSIQSANSHRSESTIKKNDILSIVISSLNRDEDMIYNAPALSPATASGGSTSTSGYQVDAGGNIQLHKLGTIHAEGMTRAALKTKIQTDLQPYLKDPVVTVRYLNHRVTVLGEVAKPQVIQMPEEQLSLFEVLGTSGDVTQFARKDHILIVRETETGKQLKRINLEDHSIFSSEWYYLQPDDVVYVEPNDLKVNEAKRQQKQQTVSLILSGASLAAILLTRIFP